jgi:hypothetical protein
MISSNAAVVVNGVTGRNYMLGGALYWGSDDGTQFNYLGTTAVPYNGVWVGSTGQGCANAQGFDSLNGDTGDCIFHTQSQGYRVVQWHYLGNHAAQNLGFALPDCAYTTPVVNTPPCIQYTIMTNTELFADASAFNPDMAASGFPTTFTNNCGSGSAADACVSGTLASQDGDFCIQLDYGQNSFDWFVCYALNNRQPEGTAGGVALAGVFASYRSPICAWCNVHSFSEVDNGWLIWSFNNLYITSPPEFFTTTLTSAILTGSVGGAGGLSTCPVNTLGVPTSGPGSVMCTPITIGGDPTNGASQTLQHVQVGDVMMLWSGSGPLDYSEVFRVLTVASPTSITLYRGYLGTTPQSHTATLFTMQCGMLPASALNNATLGGIGAVNYRNDPLGKNASLTTIQANYNVTSGHGYANPYSPVALEATGSNTPAGCSGLGGNYCAQSSQGNYPALLTAPVNAISLNPPFAGVVGGGAPNAFDTHPGTCFNGQHWCGDERPFDGGGGIGTFSQFGSTQCWSISPGTSALNRKFLSTLAFVGRNPLLDVSGPGVILGCTSADSFKYCVALAGGECHSGSSPGDIWVNAPWVSTPSCSYMGIARQGDETTRLCIMDLGAYGGQMMQLGWSVANDMMGAGSRNLGSQFARWNQHDVFANLTASPSGTVGFSFTRWMEETRSVLLSSVLPPFPAPDSVTRNTFIPIPVSIDPPAGLSVQSALVEFGYAENGAGSYYCTSRQEACVATGAAMNVALPFSFEQTETFTPAPCATGCTIAIPALPQRALYYRWKYLDASGNLIGTSQAHVVATP